MILPFPAAVGRPCEVIDHGHVVPGVVQSINPVDGTVDVAVAGGVYPHVHKRAAEPRPISWQWVEADVPAAETKTKGGAA